MPELVIGRFHVCVRADGLDENPCIIRDLDEECNGGWRLLRSILDVNVNLCRVESEAFELSYRHLGRIVRGKDLVKGPEDSSTEVVEVVVVLRGRFLDFHR